MFILKEYLMNGTVSIGCNVTGVDIDDFNLAKLFVREGLYKIDTRVVISEDDDKLFKYHLTGGVVGILENKPLQFINSIGSVYDKS